MTTPVDTVSVLKGNLRCFNCETDVTELYLPNLPNESSICETCWKEVYGSSPHEEPYWISNYNTLRERREESLLDLSVEELRDIVNNRNLFPHLYPTAKRLLKKRHACLIRKLDGISRELNGITLEML